jgi:hypothetical protein
VFVCACLRRALWFVFVMIVLRSHRFCVKGALWAQVRLIRQC